MAPLADLFADVLVPGVPVVEKIVRPILVYVFLTIVLRLFGRRELGPEQFMSFAVQYKRRKST